MLPPSVIDLRSDTVTQPTPAMRQAMATTVVGDDVYGEDPTVNQLEEQVAGLLGKEAGLFVPSGTMGNLISILTHCGRGEEVVVGDRAHTYLYERLGSAVLGGVALRPINTASDGRLPLSLIERAIQPDDIHCSKTRLVCLENTQADCGGIPLPLDYLNRLSDALSQWGNASHCDGARIWNAAVATAVEPKVLASPFDSLSVCLSKGLAAPAGSVIVGTTEFINEARRNRKLLGGGMRQVGILAAAGLVAIAEMRVRLEVDHDNAQTLARGLMNLGCEVLHPVRTNIVFCHYPTEKSLPLEQALLQCKQQGLLFSSFGPNLIRFVTHYGINKSQIEQATKILANCLKQV